MRGWTRLKTGTHQLATRLPLALQGSPPRLYKLEDYRLWFPRTQQVFRRYLHQSGALSFPASRSGVGPAGVLVVPWVGTPTPWYAVMLAIGLARRGRPVVLLWDDTGFVEDDLPQQQALIAEILTTVADAIPVVTMSELDPVRSVPSIAQTIARLADQNLTWRLRGRQVTAEDQALSDEIEQSLTASAPRVWSALARQHLDFLVIPGGVYGTSGLFRYAARSMGIRVATFDSDQGVGQVCVDGVAAQNGDIARAFDELWASDVATKAAVINIARNEYRLRTEGRDGYGFQTTPAAADTAARASGVLMPLNVEWDTAALGKHLAFDSTPDWLTTTIHRILEVDDGPVTVRQHPSERRKFQRGNLDIAGILAEHFGADPRVRFVAADDPVSTYDLLRTARLVLPYVSTIAIEAAAMGKPVIVSGDAYYGELGFVWASGSREQYLDLVRRGLLGELQPLDEQIDRAWICFYLTAVRNRIPTDFTPHPKDFWSWSRRDMRSLFNDPEIADMLAAIDENVPVSVRRHQRLCATEIG